MTTLKKNTLAVALVAAMGFAANAGAYTLQTSGDQLPEQIATFDIAGNATVITTAESFQILLDNSAAEGIIARTVGFNIVIELDNGATFDVDPVADTSFGTNTNWKGTVVAGGAGTNFVTIDMEPTTNPADGLIPGELVRFASEDLTDLAALQTAGTLHFTVTFRDPVTNAALYPAKVANVLQTGDPTDLNCDATGADTWDNFYPDSRIDVGTNDGAYDSKTTFSHDGVINNGGYYYFNAGSILVDTKPAFSSFVYQTTDTFETVLTGTSFAAFAQAGDSVTMHTHCGNDITGTVSADGTKVTFDYTGADLCTSTEGHWDVQFYSDSSALDVIDATTISATTTFSRGAYDSTGGHPNCALLPMQYNGSVVKVATFNPAGNTTQQSFLRVTNPSNIDGLVTISGVDDTGAAAPNGDVTFTLAAGESMQINSDTLEGGGGSVTGKFGDGTGKWRLVVTGEFAGMRVASLNRNNNTGTVTNLTDYDTAQEQSTPANCGWSGGNSCYSGSDSY